MKKSTTTIETCRTELTLTLWNKVDRETYNQTVYVFTPKVPITIETAEKLVKQKHYLLALSTTIQEDYARLNDSIVLDIALGAHIMLSRDFTADEWYYSGCKVKPASYSLSRNMHIYTVVATTYDRVDKSVINEQRIVLSFRPMTQETIKKRIENESDGHCVILELEMNNMQHTEETIYLSELQAYSAWC